MRQIRKILVFSGIVGFAGLMTSCAYPMRQPLSGPLYSDTQATENVTSLAAAPRTGKACMQSILGVTTGDASMEAARKDGHITQVSYVDNTSKGILGVWAEYCIVVHGR